MRKLPAIPDDLITALKANRAIAIVGSGLSYAAGAPSWRDLLLRIAARTEELCPRDIGTIAEAIQAIERGQYLASASILKGVLKHQLPGEIVRALTRSRSLEIDSAAINQATAGTHTGNLFKAKSDPVEVELRPTPSHRTLVQLGFRAIITTNYDRLLCQALPGSLMATTWKLSWSDSRLAVAIRNNTPFILKLHGDVDHTADLILAREDYDGVLHNESLRGSLRTLFGGATPFWIGYGHSDLDLDLLIDELRINLDLDGGCALAMHSAALERRFEHARIFPSWLSHYDQVPAYLRALAAAVGKSITFSVVVELPWVDQAHADDIVKKLAESLSAPAGCPVSVIGAWPHSIEAHFSIAATGYTKLASLVESRDAGFLALLASHKVSHFDGRELSTRPPASANIGSPTPPNPATKDSSPAARPPRRPVQIYKAGALVTGTVFFLHIPGLKELDSGPLVVRILTRLHDVLYESLKHRFSAGLQVLSTLTGAIVLIPDKSQIGVLGTLDALSEAIAAEKIPVRIGVSRGEYEALADADASLNFIGVPINVAARLATSDKNPGALAEKGVSRHLRSILESDDWLHESKSTRQVTGKRQEVFECYPCPGPDFPIDPGNFPRSGDRPKSINAIFLAYDLPSFSEGDRAQLSQRFRAVGDVFERLKATSFPKDARLYFSPGGDGGVLVLSHMDLRPGYDLALRLMEEFGIEGLHRTKKTKIDARIGLHYRSVLLYENAQGEQRPAGLSLFVADEIIADDQAKKHSDKVIFTGAFKDVIGGGCERYFNDNYVSLPRRQAGLLENLERYVKRELTPNP